MTALAALGTLPVKGRAPKTGYARAEFGPAWSDVDGNGCDTRNDILRRDMTAVQPTASSACFVAAGQLVSPYTAEVITFTNEAPAQVQIDHVVALGDAWQTGAFSWTMERRVHFGNDPLNLLAVDGHSNQQKSDSNAASWLPRNKAFRCQYVARQIAVKAKYQLWLVPPEAAAAARILNACPDLPLPTDADAAARPPVQPGARPAPTAIRTTAPATPSDATDPRYGSCREVKAHGLGPYEQGSDPEYGWYQDGDGDGVVCE